MRMTFWIGALATMFGSALYAQDIGGDWQGTLKAGSQEIRLVVKIERILTFKTGLTCSKKRGIIALSFTKENVSDWFWAETSGLGFPIREW